MNIYNTLAKNKTKKFLKILISIFSPIWTTNMIELLLDNKEGFNEIKINFTIIIDINCNGRLF